MDFHIEFLCRKCLLHCEWTFFALPCVNCLPLRASLNKILTEETQEIEEELEQVPAKDLHCCEICNNRKNQIGQPIRFTKQSGQYLTLYLYVVMVLLYFAML